MKKLYWKAPAIFKDEEYPVGSPVWTRVGSTGMTLWWPGMVEAKSPHTVNVKFPSDESSQNCSRRSNIKCFLNDCEKLMVQTKERISKRFPSLMTDFLKDFEFVSRIKGTLSCASPLLQKRKRKLSDSNISGSLLLHKDQSSDSNISPGQKPKSSDSKIIVSPSLHKEQSSETKIASAVKCKSPNSKMSLSNLLQSQESSNTSLSDLKSLQGNKSPDSSILSLETINLKDAGDLFLNQLNHKNDISDYDDDSEKDSDFVPDSTSGSDSDESLDVDSIIMKTLNSIVNKKKSNENLVNQANQSSVRECQMLSGPTGVYKEGKDNTVNLTDDLSNVTTQSEIQQNLNDAHTSGMQEIDIDQGNVQNNKTYEQADLAIVDNPVEKPPLLNRNLPDELKLFCSQHAKVYVKKYEKLDGARPYDCVHACYYCGYLFTNIQNHFEKKHCHKEEVKEIQELVKILNQNKESNIDDKHIKEKISSRRNNLRFKGDHYHNQTVMDVKEGELLISRRLIECFDSTSYKPCPSCLQWLLLNKNFSKHRDTCSAGIFGKKNDLLIQADILCGQITKADKVVASPLLLKEVLPSMKSDEISTIAKADDMILCLGDIWLSKCVGNKRRRKHFSSFRMRLAAKFLDLLRKDTGELENLSHFLCPRYFDKCVTAALNACEIEEIKTSLKHPSTALKLGYDLNRLGAIKMGFGIRNNSEQLKKEAQDFINLMKMEWGYKVSRMARVILEERAFNRSNPLPFPEDIQKLSKFLIERLSNDLDYRDMLMTVQAYILMYNKRRPGEIEELTLDNCKLISEELDEVEESLLGNLTDTEKYLAKSQRLIYVRGKGGRGVPILLPECTRKGFNKLCNIEERTKAGVPKSNKYLFANTADDVIRAGDSLKLFVHSLDLRGPSRITATNCRKYIATITQVFALKDHELKWFTNHLSHTTKVHERFYRATSGAIERIQIGKLMMIAENNLVQKFHGKELKNIQFEEIIYYDDNSEDKPEYNPEVKPEVERNKQTENYTEFQSYNDSDIDEEGMDLVPKRKKKTNCGKRPHHKWSEVEIKEISTYLHDFLQNKVLPKPKDILVAMEHSKRDGGILWKREVATIKKKIWNMNKK